ncbi:polysaccharide biosynthesis tyrosine autokinase [Streptomyces sp. ME02-8801-2C]|uniref:polysaccharide biosynthesis tyrosine autokinase n=1 Tax=Streptomyces sp. ME02-8801-2C TaxID=3028680 RepID=UPI0029B496A4|nr:polysaccharide biosynthesis tyrosine autokinase [Streptomyces sp. ME02-8801-2C]MDX3451817.1 polysaccharide biosynthesis tyrosine autokinase [Streptomyces sp. ME02-8801-2C]
MDLREYINVLRRRWRFVVACALLGLAAAVVVTTLTPRTYTAKAQLFIATIDKDSTNAYAGGLFTQQRVKSYTQIANSPPVLTKVISRLDLDTTPEHLAKKISARAPLDTTLIDIRVQDRSATRAQAIADETAAEFTKYIDTIEKSSPDAPPLVKASVVGDPEAPSAPTSPRPPLNLAIGLLAGVVVGVAGAVLRHSLDTTLRSAGDVRRCLGLTTVGALPKPHRGHARAGHPVGTTRRDEALSQLRTRLLFSTDGRMPSSVLVTSTVSGEGRTETALDLASNVARAGRRVVLIEADLRRPRLAETLGLHDRAGLTDVVTGGVALDDALQWCGDGPIRVLTSGAPPPDPSALLSSPHMTQLLRTLKADADLVVVDSPPLLAFADGAILASEAEGVLLVTRIGKTRYDLVRRALDNLTAVRAQVLGAVLTGTPPERRVGRHPDRAAKQRSGAPLPRHQPSSAPAGIRDPAGHRW